VSERWLWATLLVAACIGVLALLRRRSPLSLPVLAIGMTAVVGTFYPLASLFIEPRSWRNLGDLTEEVLLDAQVDYLAFAVGMLLAVLVAGALRPRLLAAETPPPPATARVRFRDEFVVGGLLAAGTLLYAIYVQRVGLATLTSTHDFAEKYLASRGLGVFLLGLNLMIAACLWAEAGEVSRRTRVVLRAVGLGILAWATLFIAVRAYAAALVLGYAHVLCARRRVRLDQVRPSLVLMLVAAYLGLEGYAILRSTWTVTGDLGRALELAADVGQQDALGSVVGGSELSHPFITTAEVARFEEAGALGGESYLEALLCFVPSFLWPDRPETLAQRFVAEYYPLLDERGGGSAFTFVGEAWWNFGHVTGPLLAGLVLAGLLLLVGAGALRAPHGPVTRLSPYLVYLVLLFHRSQLSALFKSSMSVVLPALALWVLAELLRGVLVERRSLAPTRALAALPRPAIASGPRLATRPGTAPGPGDTRRGAR
jgi:hypothetical protein